MPTQGFVLAQAAENAKPGTESFRPASRDAIQTSRAWRAKAAACHGIAPHHAGLDARAAVVVRIEGGTWMLEQ